VATVMRVVCLDCGPDLTRVMFITTVITSVTRDLLSKLGCVDAVLHQHSFSLWFNFTSFTETSH